MKNKMFVRLFAIATGLTLASGSVVMTTAGASASVSTAAVSNGPIYYPTNTGSVGAINPDGSTATTPTFLNGIPSYSSDGELVTWVSEVLGAPSTYSLKVAKADGSEMKTLATAATNVSFHKPQFTADKTEIIFYDKQSSTTNIVKVNVSDESQTPTIVIASGGNATNISDLAVSTKGDIAFIANACSGTSGVYVQLADGTYSPPTGALPNTCSAAGSTQKTASSIAWDLEGNNLFVARNDFDSSSNKFEIFSAVPGTGITTTALASETGTATSSLALSPDGLKIAYGFEIFNQPKSVKIINIDGSNPSGPFTLPNNALRVAPLGWGHSFASSGGDEAPGSDSGDSNESESTESGSNGSGSTGSNNTTTTVVPGVTVTDTTVYTKAPKNVASSSSVSVMTLQETKTQRIVSNTPAVCLPNKNGIVFIDEGRCSASILDKKTGEVLRRFRTTVVEDKVSDLKVGNEVAILAPIYFDGGSTDVNAKGMKRIRGLKSKITTAGSVLVVGHSGIALGDTEANRLLSRERAISTVKAMKKVGAQGPFFATGVGGKDPLVTSTSGDDQGKNRRVVIILVP